METLDTPTIEALPERRFCVRRHFGPAAAVDDTRRPMYQHMISHELVGGPSVLRHIEQGDAPDHTLDVLIGATCNFDGDSEVRVEVVAAGDYAVLDFEGPESAIPAALDHLRAWVEACARTAIGPVLQVHLMDAIDGIVEQQFQLALAPRRL